MIRDMSKLLFLLYSCLFFSCYEVNNENTASKKQEITIEPDTTIDKSQLEYYCENLTVDITVNLSDNIPFIQEWWYSRKKTVQKKVKDKEYLIKLVITSPKAVLTKDKLGEIREQVAIYKDVLHKIIGKSNGYPKALILEIIKYEEENKNTMYLSIVSNVNAECFPSSKKEVD